MIVLMVRHDEGLQGYTAGSPLRTGAALLCGKVLAPLKTAYGRLLRRRGGIYFFYDHSIHHVHHTVYIAAALSLVQDRLPVYVLSASHEASRIVQAELSVVEHRVEFGRLPSPFYFSRRSAGTLFHLLAALAAVEPAVVVVPDFYDNALRKLGVESRWVFTSHGVPGRGYLFDPHVSLYDLYLVSSQWAKDKILSELSRRGISPPRRMEVVGYPKFDYFRFHSVSRPPRGGDPPRVLYNPHFEPSLSSFFEYGVDILEALCGSGRYEVVFMPHPDLSRRHCSAVRRVKRLGLPHLEVVERPPCNLEVMADCDVYVTDVSSSVYEWLYFDRPCITFVTPRAAEEKGDIVPLWHLGYRVSTVSDLVDAVEDAVAVPGRHAAVRREWFERLFGGRGGDEPASVRAASAIVGLLEDG